MQTFELNRIFQNWLDTPAFISKKVTTYNQLLFDINQTTKYLSQKGIDTGDIVAIISETNDSFLKLFLALLQMGAIAVPLNKKLPERQIFQLLSKINCSKVFDDDEIVNNEHSSNIELFKTEEFIQKNLTVKSSVKFKPISLEQDSTIIFTSGSSGNPKAVLHTFGNHYFSALGSNENIPFKSGYRWLLSLPLYHVGGLSILFRAMVGGGAIVIPDGNLSLIENIKKYNVTHVSLVATQLIKLLEDKSSHNLLVKLKCILVGGSYIPSNLIKQAITYHLPIFTTYGSTEMASQTTTTKPDESSKKLFTSGKLLNHRELKISEDSEILVKGKTLFKGFVETDNLIKPFDSDGWYHTGDSGIIDHEDYLTVIGRKDNMFISGGENVYPEEIEINLLNMEEIKSALVIDIPNEKFGARPIAFIKAYNYDIVNKRNIIKYLSEHLPKFKIPDAFYKWPEAQIVLKPNRTDFILLYNNQEVEEIVK